LKAGAVRAVPLCEAEDAPRELLLQPFLVTVVRLDVDRLLVEERVVETVDPPPYRHA